MYRYIFNLFSGPILDYSPSLFNRKRNFLSFPTDESYHLVQLYQHQGEHPDKSMSNFDDLNRSKDLFNKPSTHYPMPMANVGFSQHSVSNNI